MRGFAPPLQQPCFARTVHLLSSSSKWTSPCKGIFTNRGGCSARSELIDRLFQQMSVEQNVILLFSFREADIPPIRLRHNRAAMMVMNAGSDSNRKPSSASAPSKFPALPQNQRRPSGNRAISPRLLRSRGCKDFFPITCTLHCPDLGTGTRRQFITRAALGSSENQNARAGLTSKIGLALNMQFINDRVLVPKRIFVAGVHGF